MLLGVSDSITFAPLKGLDYIFRYFRERVNRNGYRRYDPLITLPVGFHRVDYLQSFEPSLSLALK